MFDSQKVFSGSGIPPQCNSEKIDEIEIADLTKITQSVKTYYGYDFTDYAVSSFKRRIQRILELYKIPTVDQLIKKIESNPIFFEEFISEITVNVTEMFRDPSFWREVRNHVIPDILLNHDTFSIWHAGCSSGEEVFSMAILLKEMGILDKVNIVASDIDKPMLTKAERGEYLMKNMELNEKNYMHFQGKSSLKEYYKEKNGKAVMDKSLIEKVSFSNYDLVRGSILNQFNLILCRNVMIYFNQSLQNNVLKKLYESLFKYGYLGIGSKESLIWCEIANKFKVVNSEEKIYRKIEE